MTSPTRPPVVGHARLCWLRWMAETGQLEHDVAGPSTGPFAASIVRLPSGGLACSADRADVLVNAAGTKAACRDGHRWRLFSGQWRQVR